MNQALAAVREQGLRTRATEPSHGQVEPSATTSAPLTAIVLGAG
ncbi:MAG: hypothetical protein ACLTMP_14760 [Eggerthella lenta]